MWTLLIQSWTSASTWTKLRLYVASLFTIAEAALPVSASICSVVVPPTAPTCVPYMSLNVATSFIAGALVLLLPFTLRWELISRAPSPNTNGGSNGGGGGGGGGNGGGGRDSANHISRLSQTDRAVSFLRSLLNVAHFVMFIVANLQLFRMRSGIQQCPDTPALFSLTLAWLILFYIKLFGPMAVMLLGCLSLPLLLVIATHLNRRQAERHRLANKLPDNTLALLPVRTFAGSYDPLVVPPSTSSSPPDGGVVITTTTSDNELVVPHDDATCVICLDEYVVGDSVYLLPCRHFFHASCLRDWFQLSKLCPMCKQDLVVLIRDHRDTIGDADKANTTTTNNNNDGADHHHHRDHIPLASSTSCSSTTHLHRHSIPVSVAPVQVDDDDSPSTPTSPVNRPIST